MAVFARPPAHSLGYCALLLGLTTVSACAGNEDETCDIASAQMSAVALIIDSGTDIRASVDFELGDRRGRGSPLALCDTDRLTIHGQSPTSFDKASRIEYAVTLDADADRRFEFVLDRGAEDERIAFEVELPPAFTFVSPQQDDPLALDQPQSIEWEPAVGESETMQVGLSEALGGGECLLTTPEFPYEERGGVPVPDTGQWTIEANELTTDSLEPCDATYTLTRLALGEYPADFERGGRIEARVERYRDVVVTP